MTSCSSPSVRRCRPLLGTFVEVSVWGEAARADRAIAAAFDAVERVQRLMSFHEPASELGRLNRDAGRGPVTVSAWTFLVVSTARELSAASQGAFDPTIAPILQGWGLLPGDPRNTFADPGDWRDLELGSRNRIRFARPLTLDLGGIAKGFAVDCAVEAMQATGIESGLVNAGGDLRAFGSRTHAVQVRDPRFPGHMAHEFRLGEAGLATSAPTFSRRPGPDGFMSHLVDPATGAAHVRDHSVSVQAPTCLLADALTKVVLFGGSLAESVLAHYRAEAWVLSAVDLPLAA